LEKRGKYSDIYLTSLKASSNLTTNEWLYAGEIHRASPTRPRHPATTTSTEHEKRSSILTDGKHKFQRGRFT
jgi:hypothetical protein